MTRIPDAPHEVLRIIERLEEAGFETWAVGGVIRDALLGSDLGDWDLATQATPQEVIGLFRRTVPIGLDHGTVGVLGKDRTLFEVTTFRKDIETMGRRAVVEFADRIEDDLARRDFTINAIAWHPLHKKLLDPFGGEADLEARRLRTVGDAGERFSEDLLRVLRALRFAAVFRLTVLPETWTALCDATGQLDILSGERVREELMKVLGGDGSPSAALSLYAAAGVLEALYPELEAEGEGWLDALVTCDALPASQPILRFVAILEGALEDRSSSAPTSRNAAGIMDRLRFSNADARLVSRLLDATPVPTAEARPADRRRWLSSVGSDLVGPLGKLALAKARARHVVAGADTDGVIAAWRDVRATRSERPPLTLDDLAIGGDELISLGHTPGPRFGDALEAMLDRVLEDPALNTVDHLKAIAVEVLGSPGASDPGRTAEEDAE